jgi:type II secretory pathway component GspD/PulD (secretin)
MLALIRFVVVGALFSLPSVIALAGPTPDPQMPVVVRYARSELDDVLYFYSQLSGKPLHVDAGVGGIVDIMSQGDIPRAEALGWLRKQLLEHYGIEIHDVPGSDIRVSWSADHDQVREATKHSLKTVPEARTIDTATLHAKKPQ